MQKEEDGLLPVELDGTPLCRVSQKGAIHFRPEEQDEAGESLIWGKVADIARSVNEYTRQMNSAPFLGSPPERTKMKYFMTGTPLAGLERQMMTTPNFKPCGHGRIIFNRFRYKPEDVDCKLCTEYKHPYTVRLPNKGMRQPSATSAGVTRPERAWRRISTRPTTGIGCLRIREA